MLRHLGGSSREKEPRNSELRMEEGRGKQRKAEPGWAQDFIPGQRKLVKCLGKGECNQSSHYNLWGEESSVESIVFYLHLKAKATLA